MHIPDTKNETPPNMNNTAAQKGIFGTFAYAGRKKIDPQKKGWQRRYYKYLLDTFLS